MSEDDEGIFHFELKAFNDKIQEIIDEFLEDLTTKYDNDPKWTLQRIIEKWEKRREKNEK